MLSVVRSTDQEARLLSRELLHKARCAALSVLDEHKAPFVSRIAFYAKPGRVPYSLVSELSNHTKYLEKNTQTSLLVGETEPNGDPLSYPRLTLQAKAKFVPRDNKKYPQLRDDWITHYPKSRLYADFADFLFVEFHVTRAYLVAGFGKAYALTDKDLKADNFSEVPTQ